MFEDRYKRNIVFSDVEQKKLFDAKVIVFGCGGLGGYVIECLARIGVGNFILVDGDKFSISNLNRQLYSLEDNIGMSKSKIAKDRVLSINSDINVINIDRMISDFENYIDKDVTCVVSCLDSISGRIKLEKACKINGIPLVSGSIGGFMGQLTSVFPGEDTISKFFKDKKDDDIKGNLSTVACSIGALEANECVKVITGKGELLRKKILLIDFENNDYVIVDIG